MSLARSRNRRRMPRSTDVKTAVRRALHEGMPLAGKLGARRGDLVAKANAIRGPRDPSPFYDLVRTPGRLAKVARRPLAWADDPLSTPLTERRSMVVHNGPEGRGPTAAAVRTVFEPGRCRGLDAGSERRGRGYIQVSTTLAIRCP